MRLDVTCMRYLTKDDMRVLTAVETGMRNHELVPVDLISTIARLRHGGSHKILSTLLRFKLIAHEADRYDGYRLSYLGYDILALRTLLARGKLTSVGSKIGVGKESDIYEAQDENGAEVVLKIHRLGRTSFRTVRKNRDYMDNKRKSNWLYMSRLAAMKEYAFMQALHTHGFPTPTPIDQNRHIVVMSRVSGFPMAQIKAGQMENADNIFGICIAILRRLAEYGLIHCDFNEFNLMIDVSGNVTLIDFPQMVSTSHPNAQDLLTRDINCLIKFFAMKMRYIPPEHVIFSLSDVILDPNGCNIYHAVQSQAGGGEGEWGGAEDEKALQEYLMSGKHNNPNFNGVEGSDEDGEGEGGNDSDGSYDCESDVADAHGEYDSNIGKSRVGESLRDPSKIAVSSQNGVYNQKNASLTFSTEESNGIGKEVHPKNEDGKLADMKKEQDQERQEADASSAEDEAENQVGPAELTPDIIAEIRNKVRRY